MPSFRAKLLNAVLRKRHWLRFEKREVFDFNTSIQKFRDNCEQSARRLAKLPDGIRVEAFQIKGIPAEFIHPSNENGNKIIFYVHGGGYVSGSCNDHRNIVSRFVVRTGIKLLHFEYRLAPEHPYPAALEDSLSVYNYLLETGLKSSDIIIAGESAGGGLALCILLALKERGIELPSRAVVISPWTDLKCTGESYKTKSEVSLAPPNSWTVFSKYYYGENNPECPFISPLYGDLKGLPPTLIYAGEDDELIDDSIRFTEIAKKAGSTVFLKTGKGMVHCYPLLPDFIPESKMAFEDICEFMRNEK